MICKLGLSLKYVRGPLRRCLGRCMVFHRFGHATHSLDATLQCPAHRGKVLSAYQFFAVLIDTLNAPMHRIQSVLPNLQLKTTTNFDITNLTQKLGNRLVNLMDYATFISKL